MDAAASSPNNDLHGLENYPFSRINILSGFVYSINLKIKSGINLYKHINIQ